MDAYDETRAPVDGYDETRAPVDAYGRLWTAMMSHQR